MKKKFKFGLFVFIFTIIPGIAAYLGKQNNVLDDLQADEIIGKNFPLSTFKSIVLILGVVLSSLILTIRLEVHKNKNKQLKDQRVELIKENRKSFIKALQSQIPGIPSPSGINIRIWIPKTKRLECILKFIKTLRRQETRKILTIKNVEGLSDTGTTDELQFEVHPKVEGLVGRCYDGKEIVFEEDLFCSDYEYNLNRYQENKTIGTRFCLSAPIFNYKDKVIAVISMDSEDRAVIETDEEQILYLLITMYCQKLYDNMRDLFK